MISAKEVANKISFIYNENSLFQEWDDIITNLIESIIEEDRKILREEYANKAIDWCKENMNDHSDITNPPRFDEYDEEELRAIIEEI